MIEFARTVFVNLTNPPSPRESDSKKPVRFVFFSPEIWLEKIYACPIFFNIVRGGEGIFK